MRPRLNLSLRRALMAAMATACTLASSAYAGVVDEHYDLQYYLDFARNKGMFTAGATNIGVFFKDGTSIANNVIPLMPNFDSYGQTVTQVVQTPGMPAPRIATNGGTNLVSSQFVYGAKHVHAKIGNKDVAFLSENASNGCMYQSANLDMFGHDSSLQRLTKLVTSVAYTPMADDAFMSTIEANDTWIYRLGNGGAWSAGDPINTDDNAMGGVINLSIIRRDEATGNWHMEGWARYNDTASDILTPLDIGTYFGDSGSPSFAWDNANNRFVFIGAMWASGVQTSFPNWYLPSYNPSQAAEVMNKYTVSAAFSGTDTILWGTQDATTGQGTLTQGSATVTYTGVGSENGIDKSLGLTFSTEGQNEQTLQLQGSVNMGAGALTFVNGKWKLTEAGSGYTLTSAGFDIQGGAEVTWELTGSSSQEIRKVGEGILTISGFGNNESALVVGGGTTVYEVTRDENDNIIGCTLGNAGETRLNRTGGYAASSVRLEGGVAIIVLMDDGQFKTNSTAGDTFSFGNDGGLLNLNGHDLTWGVIKQEGSGKGARIGNFTPQGLDKPENATFTYTGTGTFAGCFMDEAGTGKGSAQLAVNYNNAGGTWYLTGNHSNAGGFNVQAGTMVLQGTNTPHVMMTDSADWTYASIQGADVAVQSGGTFQLSHHALMQGDVIVADGGSFVLNQTVNAATESISGSLRQDMAKAGITSLIGDVTLQGNGTMTADVSSPVVTTIQGNITGTSTTINSQFTKTGCGILAVNGQLSVVLGTVEAGGLVVKDGENFVSNLYAGWKIGEQGFLAVEGIENSKVLGALKASSSFGVLALTQNQTTELNLAYHQNLIIGAWGDVSYGTSEHTLGTVYDSVSERNVWRLGGGTGTLTVNFKLSGDNDLIIGNEYSGGTVHLANEENDFTGKIYIKGLGNILTYEEGALGLAKVSLSYGNAMSLYSEEQFEIIDASAGGVMAIAANADIDMSGKQFSLGAYGDLIYTKTLKVNADGTYRFGGVGNLTLDTALDSATSMELDAQGLSGSSVTFARANAFTGDVVVGSALYMDNSMGDIAVHAGHEDTFASVSSIEFQKGSVLYTDGQDLKVNNLSMKSGSALVNNGETDSHLTLSVGASKSTALADGVLTGSIDAPNIHITKTGAGTLTMGYNSSWTGSLTISEGTVKGTLTRGSDSFRSAGGIGAAGNVIHIEKDGVLYIDAVAGTGRALGGTEVSQVLTGTGTIEFSGGGSAYFSTQSQSFEGTLRLLDNTRLYLGTRLEDGSGSSRNTVNALSKAIIEVTDGSQVRITSALNRQYAVSVNVYSDFILNGDGFKGARATEGDSINIDKLPGGALSIDFGSTVYGDVTLASDSSISSISNTIGANNAQCTWGTTYGIQGYLGGTIRGRILGVEQGDGTISALSITGNEGITITADSANTFGDLNIVNSGTCHNTDVYALRLDGGAARSQVSTALGKGTVTLEDGLILRLAGTGAENNSDVVYTYANAMNVGNGATLQSYNITNRLTGAVSMTGNSLNLATARGGVLELAGGIDGSGTLNVAAASKIILGSAASGYALARNASAQFSGTVNAAAGADITLASTDVVSPDTTFSGTDSLTLRFAGTEDYTLGGITMSGDSSALTLHFDFTNTPVADNGDTWNTLTVSNGISATSTIIALDLNMFGDIESGSYTLITSAGNATNYTLADTLNDRLSLSTETGALVLNVGIDNKLYWSSADDTSQDWAEANWLKGKVGTLTAFSSGSNVMLDDSGVAEGNSATARETISVADAQTVGTIGVQDSAYELTGAGSLSGTSLTVGNGGDLKLSNTGGNTFSNGVLVSGENSSLESAVNMAAAVSVEDGGAYTQSGGKLTGNLSVTDASAGIRNASIAGNINTYGSGTLSLDAATLSDAARDITFAYGKLAATANTTLGGTFTWVENQPTVQVQNMAISGGNVTSTVAMEVDGLDIATSKALFLTGAVSTSLDAVTGAGSVAMQSSGKLQLGEAQLLSLSALGGTTNVTGAVTISGTAGTDSDIKADSAHLSIGKATLNIEEGGSITVARFTAGNEANENSSVVNINGGTLTITGSTVGDTNANSFLLAHWKDLSSVLTLNSGKIVAENATMHMGWDSGGTFKAFGGEATLKGVLFGTTSESSGERYRADTFVLGSATKGTATLKIGSSGMTGIANEDTVTFGEGTIAATANFAISNRSGSSKAIDFVGTTGTIFDSAGHTITVNTALNGTGNIIKKGAGSLALHGSAATFSGNIDVQAGALAVNATGISALENAASVSIGSGATLDLSAINFAEAANSIDVGYGHAISFAADSTVAFANMEQDKEYGIFNITSGSLTGWSDFDADNFTIDGTRLADMGRVTVNLGMAGTFSYSIDIWDLVWKGPATGGTWDTTDTEWQTTRPNAETGEDEIISTAFVANDNAIFNTTASLNVSDGTRANNVTIKNNSTVTLDGSALTANLVTIESGSTLKGAYASVLVPVKAYNIAAGATLEVNYSGSPNFTSEVTGEGTVLLYGGGSMTWNPTDGSLNMGTLTIKGGNTRFTTASAFTANIVNMTQGTATFNSTADINQLNLTGGTAKFTQASLGKQGQTITMTGGTLELNLAGDQSVPLEATYQTVYSNIVVNNTAATATQRSTSIIKNNSSGESMHRTLSSVSIAANNTLELQQNNWNTIWQINDLSGEGNLTWKSATNHWTPSRLVLSGDGSDFTGNIKLDRTSGADESRKYQIYMEVATNDAVKGATLDLVGQATNNVVSLAINANAVTMQGLKGNEYTHLFAGASPTYVGSSDADSTHINAALGSTANNTLTIAGGKEYTFAGTVGTANETARLNLAMIGEGSQTFSGVAHVGDVSVSAGKLALSNATIYGSIAVSGGELKLGATSAASLGGEGGVSLTGGTLDLSAVTFSASGGVALAGAMSVSGGLIELGSSMTATDTAYAIFDLTADGASLANWESLKSNISVGGVNLVRYEGAALSLTEDAATLSFSSFDKTNFADLQWAGGATGTWDATTANWDRTSDGVDTLYAFANGDSVTFNSNAAVTLSQAITANAVTIADGVTVSLDESAGKLTATSISVGEGAKLSFDTKTTSASSTIGSNITGAGTVVLNLCNSETNHWNNKITMGNGFTGEVHLNAGRMTLDGSSTGSKLVLLSNAAGIQLTTSSSEVSWGGDLELRGTHEMHSNSSTKFTFTGNVSGTGTYTKKSTGTLTFGATGTVNLGGFTQDGDGATIFAGATTLNGLNATAGSVSFGGATSTLSGTLNASTLNLTDGAMKVNFTSANTDTITDNASGSFTVGTLNYTGGTLEMSGNVNITTLKVGAGLTATVYNKGGNAGQNKTFGTVELANGAILKTYDNSKVSAATDFGTLKLMGDSATIQDHWHAGYYHVDALTMGTGVTSSTLELKKTAASSLATVFELGNEGDTTSAFAGKINLNQSNTGKGRSSFVVLSNASIAQNAVISMTDASDTSESAYIGLGINADNATIAGLESKESNGSIAKLFSGTIGTQVEWIAKSGKQTPPDSVGDAVRTLNITTKAGGDHAFYGEVLGSLNLVIDGEGTQKFLGTSSSFNGTLTVQGGTAAFNSAGSSLLEGATSFTLSNDGVLDLSAIAFGTDAANAITLASGATYTFSGGVIDLGALEANSTYHIFDTTSGGTLQGWTGLTLENFSLAGEAMTDIDGATLTLGADGTFSYTTTEREAQTLYWSNAAGNNVWSASSKNWNTAEDTTSGATLDFNNADSVVFGSTAAVSVQGALQAASMSVADNATVTLTLNADAELTLDATELGSGSTLSVSNPTDTEVTISGITGSGTLVKTGSGTLNLGDAELRTLDFTHLANSFAQPVGELVINGTVTISDTLRVGDGTLKIEEGADVTTQSLKAVANGQNANSRIEINGGDLTITGTTDVEGESNSFILGHWHNSATTYAQLTLNDGSLTAENTSLYMDYDSPGVFKALGGEATLKGIRFRNITADADTFELGTATSATDSVTVTIGSTGIVGMADNDVIKLGGGTLKASADFAITAQSGATPSVSLIGTTSGTVFDTNGHDITVNTVLTGSGKLVKNSAGNLIFTADNTYTGDTTINAGSIVLNLGAVNGVNREYSLDGKISGSGTLEVATGTTLVVANDKTISSALLVNGGVVDVTANNKQVMAGNITVQNGGELKFSYSGSSDKYDCFVIGDTAYTITLNNGTLDLGAMRHTMKNWSISMSNGSLLKGTGSNYSIGEKSYIAALDVATNNMTISSTSGDNEISAVTRLRTHTLKYNVTGGTLTISGEIMSDGSNPSITKEGAGDLIFTRDHTFAGTTTISAGKLVLDLGAVNTGEGENAVTTNSIYSLDGAVSGNGTLQVKGGTTVVADAAAETISTAVILEKDSVLKLANSTTNTLSKDVTKGTSGAGILQVESGTTLANNSKNISADLVLNGGNATLKGSKCISGDITVNSGSTLTADGTNDDTLVYTDASGDYTRTLTINAGGELALGSRRWSMGNENQGSGGSVYDIVLNGGKITGNGTITNNAATGNLDFFENGKITATGNTGEISAEIRVRNDNNKLALNVTNAGDKLDVSGTIVGSGGISKGGSGTLVLSGANTYADDTQITGGTLELQGAGKLGAGDVSISAGAALTAATTAVKDDAGNVTTASETWARITAGEKQTAATVSGASITQTEAEKKLSIAARTAGTTGSMVHSVVEMLAGTSLTVEHMVISGASSLRGQAQMTYAARSAAAAQTTISNSTFLLSTDNSKLAGENKAMTLTQLQPMTHGDTTGALTLSGNSNVLSVTSSLLSGLVLTSGTNFVVDFSSLLADVNLAAVDFVELSFANVSFADISSTQISGVLNPTTNLTAYYNNNVADAGAHSIYFDVRAIPEPTTSTLSLLALAALVARRRRK